MKPNRFSEQAVNDNSAHLILIAWRAYFILALLQGLLAMGLFLAKSSQSENHFFLSLSLPRMLIAVGMVLVLFALSWLLYRSWSKPAWCLARVNWLSTWLEHPRRFAGLLCLFTILLVTGFYFTTVTVELDEPFTQAILIRLSPLSLWIAGLSLQTLAVLFIFRFSLVFGPSESRSGWLNHKRLFFASLGIFALILLGWLWVVRNTLSIESGRTGWNDQGAPLLETQVFLAWLAGLVVWAVILLAKRFASKVRWLSIFRPGVIDLLLALVLWGVTALLWNAMPLVPSYFSAQERAPNYEPYPNSDALAYDMSAQTLLLGQGVLFTNDIYIRRPMLALFFSGLHAIAGQDYQRLIYWQVIFLSLTPALIYLLARKLGNRMSAVMAAMLITFRGANAIALASVVTTSHAKLLMADLPASLAMVAFIYGAILWLQRRSQLLGLLAGGLLGVAILVRPELGAAILPAALFSLIIFRRPLKAWAVHMLIFSVGICLVLAPWVVRNYSLTGQVFLDTPTFRTDWLQERYQPLDGSSSLSGAAVALEKTELQPVLGAALSSRVQLSGSEPQFEKDFIAHSLYFAISPASNTVQPTPPAPQETGSLEPASAMTQILDFMRGNAALVAKFVTTHYLNSQVQTFLTLPSTLRPLDSLVTFIGHRSPEKFFSQCCSVENYVRRLPYWHKWDGNLPAQAVVPLLINLGFLALGIQQTWNKKRWLGLFPLAVGLTHLLVNALARNSGGRYIASVDWIPMLYFSYGVAAVTWWFANLLLNKDPFSELRLESDPEIVIPAGRTGAARPHETLLRRPAFYALVCGLLLLGSLLPVLERTIPLRYTEEARNAMLKNLLETPALTSDQRSALVNLLQSDGTVNVGRALYPRFYPPGKGEPGQPDPLEARPYARLGFYLVDRVYQAFNLALEQAPGRFPNASDALVIACPGGEALIVALYADLNGEPQIVLVRPDFEPGFTCVPLE